MRCTTCTEGARWVFAIVWSAAVGQAGCAAGRWPAIVPLHFGVDGVADRWGSHTQFFTLWVAVLLFLGALFGLLPRVLRGLPTSTINLPNRDYWLDWERRAATLARMGGQLHLYGAATLLLMMGLFAQIDPVAMGEATSIPTQSLWGLFGAYFTFVLAFLATMLCAYRVPASRPISA